MVGVASKVLDAGRRTQASAEQGWWMFINRDEETAKALEAPRTPRLKFLNRRRVRVTIGIALVVFGAFLLAPHFVYYTSIDAIVNAHLMSIHTPIDGVIEGRVVGPRQTLKKGDLVATVRNERVNRSFLGELTTERESLTRRVAALSEQIAGLEHLQAELGQRRRAFQLATVSDLQAARGEQHAALQAQQAVLHGKERVLQRREQLLRTGHGSQQAYDEALAERDYARAVAEGIEQTIRRLELQKQNADDGIFLGMGRNDVPYDRQRSDEIEMQILDLTARRAEQQTRVAEIGRQIAVEEARLEQAGEVTLTAPADAVVWRVLVQRDKAVQIGSEIAQLLDCRTSFIDALVADSRFETINIGDEVSYRLVGSLEFRTGRVVALRGVSATAEDRTLAAKLDAPRLNQFHVLIEPDAVDVRADTASYCQVGRHVEVRLPQRLNPWGPFKALWDVV